LNFQRQTPKHTYDVTGIEKVLRQGQIGENVVNGERCVLQKRPLLRWYLRGKNNYYREDTEWVDAKEAAAIETHGVGVPIEGQHQHCASVNEKEQHADGSHCRSNGHEAQSKYDLQKMVNQYQANSQSSEYVEITRVAA
jgi:hypothetical protein